jgi:hypothetical protein
MEKVKEEIEKIVSKLLESEFSIKVLEEDLPEKAVFQPSYAFSFSPSMPVPRPFVRYSLEEDMLYLYEVFRDSGIFKVNKDFSIEVDNLKELFDNSVERKFVWDLKRISESTARNIVDVHVKKDGSYSLNSFFGFSFCEEKCLKEKLSSKNSGKIVVYLQKSFLFEVPELDYLVNELHFTFPKGKLIFGKKSFYEASDDPMFCYLYFTKPIMEIKIGKRGRKK